MRFMQRWLGWLQKRKPEGKKQASKDKSGTLRRFKASQRMLLVL